MQNTNSQNKGDEFWEVVQNAINTGDYQELNRKVKSTINDTAEEIRNIKDDFLDSFFGASTQARTPGKTTPKKTYMQSEWSSVYKNKMPPAKPKNLYLKNPSDKVTGMLQMLAGFGIAGVVLPVEIASLVSFLTMGVTIMAIFSVALFTAVFGGGIALGMSGLRKWSFVKRFQSYVKIIGKRNYCEIKELQTKTGRTKEAIVKDLKRMIGRRYFLQGHLDQKETCLMVTHEMYDQYLLLEEKTKEQALLQQAQQAQMEKIPEECRTILEEGKSYILFIRDCNDKLPGEVISTKLDRLELLITRIFKELETNPSLAGDLRRFMNYYLPTTKKLIQAYYDLEQEPISSESMKKTKLEIENTLDTINQAFENLLNSFFDTKALDISSDISVLNTMLAQEGLTKKDFEVRG